MTELEKLDAGLEYDFWDEGVNARKLNAIEICAKLNVLPVTEEAARERAIRELFGAAGRNPTVLPTFCCDNGKNIRVGGGKLPRELQRDDPGHRAGDDRRLCDDRPQHADHHREPPALPGRKAAAPRAGQAGRHRAGRLGSAGTAPFCRA